MGYVYYIECKINGKIYIGSTSRSNYNRRFSEHKYTLRKNKHGNKHLQNTWNKYGEDAFTFEVLDTCNKENVINLEWHYVKITGSYNKNIGFNKSQIVENPNKGIKLSQERKDHISKMLKGRVGPNKGKKNPKAHLAYKVAHEKRKLKVINLCTMEIFPSIKDFIKHHNIDNTSFHRSVGKRYFKLFYFEYYNSKKQYTPVPVKFNYKKGKGCLEGIQKAIKAKYKKIMCIESGVHYESIKDAAIANGFNRRSLNDSLLNNRPHKNTNWKYL